MGARIISLLHAREEPSSENNGVTHSGGRRGRSRRRKHQVILHTSPYLRCVETAIAVSSGISQHNNHYRPSGDVDYRKQAEQSTDGKANTTSDHKDHPNHDSLKCLLRLDPFLGEWLTPEYFEHIIPPPPSETMMDRARTTLQKRGEDIVDTPRSRLSAANLPGLWGDSTTSSSPDVSSDTKIPTKEKAEVSRQTRLRAVSCDSPRPMKRGQSPLYARHHPLKLDGDILDGGSNHKPRRGQYSPPVPGHAVSQQGDIPRGYVSHARDACVDFDSAWDSVDEPQLWGDGGIYGEEWSSMHRRFRNGLQKMVDWYRMHDRPRKHYDHYPLHQYYSCRSHAFHPNHTVHAAAANAASQENNDDDYTDTALVIVTHGAGCNALVGALSSQPALLDIGTASLTMAVRKDVMSPGGHEHHQQQQNGNQLRSPMDLPVAHEYVLKVLASSDHLRPGVDPIKLPVVPLSPKLPPARPLSLSSYRRRLGTMSSLSHGHFVMMGSRAAGDGEGAARKSASPRSSPGLWGSTSIASENGGRVTGEDASVPHFNDLQRTKSVESEGASSTSSNELWTKQLPQRSSSQRGLWGSGSFGESNRRRW